VAKSVHPGLLNKIIYRCFLLHLFLSTEIISAYSVTLFDDLELIKKINENIEETLPHHYNNSMLSGYFNMPSARMFPLGYLGVGGARVPPYTIYGTHFQLFSRLELSTNYRLYNGILDQNMGRDGFGAEAERIANAKVALLSPSDGLPLMPALAVGWEDFLGTSRFNTRYAVLTKEWQEENMEISLGWGKGRMRGLFGGISWSPWRKTNLWLLRELSLMAEWDCYNYKGHPHEHPDGRKIKSRINTGVTYVGWDMLQLSLHSVRGEALSGNVSMRYPIGSSKGLFAKIKDPPYFSPSKKRSGLGVYDLNDRLCQELADALSGQGLDLYQTQFHQIRGEQCLWIKIVNNRYRSERIVRERVQDVLSAIIPPNIGRITVVVEADAFPSHEYNYRTEDLQRFHVGRLGREELSILSPMHNPSSPLCAENSLFHRHKKIWSFTARPQFLSFFGSATGKFKYNAGIVAIFDGYLLDQFYYKIQPAYLIHSTAWSLAAVDRINPSHLLNVRTDTIKYYQNHSVVLEKGYLQKSFYLKNGWFNRIAAGYFERAYGGVAVEFLHYPVQSNWAIGLESACTLKREYRGLGFTHKIRKLSGRQPTHLPFIGYQYFLDLYYFFHPLNMDIKLKTGSFLARDKGGRLEVSRTFSSGFRLSFWYTMTNGRDKVNGRTYYDKGVALAFPLDFFRAQSSRNYFQYGMSAWLRDVGASAETGKELFWTLREARQ
jgi:hypothetical protein